MVNEDPQESANRLVPKSLAVTMATASRSGESLLMESFSENHKNGKIIHGISVEDEV